MAQLENVIFLETKFEMLADFQHAQFNSDCDFTGADFKETANFDSANFLASVNFLNAKFHSTPNFARSKFLKTPPEFHGAQLHEAIILNDVVWPDAPKDRSNAADHIAAYEKLKQEMERLKRHQDELMFFSKELRARRARMPIGSAKWIANLLYEKLSGYGQSAMRPFLVLLSVWLSGVIAFYSFNISPSGSLSLQNAAGLSLSNLFSVLPLRKDFFGEQFLQDLFPTAKMFSSLQMLLGLLLIFLIGLALRNQFRMK